MGNQESGGGEYEKHPERARVCIGASLPATVKQAQSRPDLHRAGQSDLWPNDRPMLAYQRQGHENQEHAARQRREPDQPDPDGHCRGRDLCGPRLQR